MYRTYLNIMCRVCVVIKSGFVLLLRGGERNTYSRQPPSAEAVRFRPLARGQLVGRWKQIDNVGLALKYIRNSNNNIDFVHSPVSIIDSRAKMQRYRSPGNFEPWTRCGTDRGWHVLRANVKCIVQSREQVLRKSN